MKAKHNLQSVCETLRGQIVRNTFPAGSRLPVQVTLAKKYGVSHITVQRAIEKLAKEGFVRTRERKGVFVVERPPHRYHYALVFAEDPASARNWSRLYSTLVNQASVLARQRGIHIIPFYGINGHTDTEDYREFAALTCSDRLAGLIFVQGEHYVADTPLMTRPNVARVALKSRQIFPHVPVVTFDGGAFIRQALDYFGARGRRRVAMITGPRKPDVPNDLEYYFEFEMAKRDLTTKPYWTLTISPDTAVGARNCVRLLMEHDPTARPDALIIGDDNLVEDSVFGLVASRIHVPEDLEIVAQCNFPWAGGRALPVKWLGFDVRQELSVCLDLIDCQRRGEKVPPQTMVSPLFEEEWKSAAEAPAVEELRPPTGSAVPAATTTKH